jgi:hypothetical protein
MSQGTTGVWIYTEPEPKPEPQVAQPVYALELGESMSKQLRVCRALKVLHGHGIHWHQVGEHVVYFTPGDMCGCIDCATRLAHTITQAHA